MQSSWHHLHIKIFTAAVLVSTSIVQFMVAVAFRLITWIFPCNVALLHNVIFPESKSATKLRSFFDSATTVTFIFSVDRALARPLGKVAPPIVLPPWKMTILPLGNLNSPKFEFFTVTSPLNLRLKVGGEVLLIVNFSTVRDLKRSLGVVLCINVRRIVIMIMVWKAIASII